MKELVYRDLRSDCGNLFFWKPKGKIRMETDSRQWKLIYFLETKTERQIETNSEKRKLNHTKLHLMRVEIKTRQETHMIFSI